MLALAVVRHEPVPEHQVRRNRSEQLLIDPERIHVDEFETVAFGEPPRLLEFEAALVGAELGRSRRKRLKRVRTHDRTELSWNSGMYRASSSPAITIPMTTRSAGSTSVTKRSMFVEISSSKKSATVFNISCSAPVDSPTSAILTATSGKTPRAASAPANDSPSRTRVFTMSIWLATNLLPTECAAISSALTSGRPPPSSVAS